jgi:hypothetical protein
MRSRRVFAIVAAFAFFAAALLFFVEWRKTSAISLDHVTYRKLLGGRLFVDFEVVNSGNVPIQFERINGLQLHTETTDGWVTNDVKWAGVSEAPVNLPPHARTFAAVELPARIRHWRIGYKVWEPLKAERVSTKIIANTRGRFSQYLPRVFVETRTETQQLWSQALDAERWLFENPDAPIHMDIPFAAMFRDPVGR